MYLPIPSQLDCASAWLNAVKLVDDQPAHEAVNVIIDVQKPNANSTLGNPIVGRVNAFLEERGKSIEAIANTIFPQKLYQRHGKSNFIDVFNKRVLPKVGKNERWSGYYFERMTTLKKHSGENLDQLSRMIDRMLDPANKSLHKHELTLFDAERDVTGSPYGGQCLSFLSFHLLPGTPKTLLLTAQYRNHYYIEKLLGNLIGLGRLMEFVAKETGTVVGALTVVSTHATIDLPSATRDDVVQLIKHCETLPIAESAA